MRLTTELMLLPNLDYTPTTVTGWLKQFGTSYQEAIKRAIFTKQTADVHRVLKGMETNPFPFDLATLEAYRDKHIKQYLGDVDEL